jgi:hypothetical protein
MNQTGYKNSYFILMILYKRRLILCIVRHIIKRIAYDTISS